MWQSKIRILVRRGAHFNELPPIDGTYEYATFRDETSILAFLTSVLRELFSIFQKYNRNLTHGLVLSPSL
jgi:hypothetical protein